MNPAPDASMTDEEYERLEGEITAIRGLFRPYPKIKEITEAIKPLVRRNNAKTEGVVNAMIGPTRSGKSHLLSALLQGYPRERRAIVDDEGDFADRIPVLVVRVRKGNRKRVTESIYRELTGRSPAEVLRARYTEDDVIQEIARIGKACQLKLVVLDEAHQSTALKSVEGVKDIASLIKDLSNLSVFSILVVGTRKVKELIDADSELQSRTPVTHWIVPFAWTEDDVPVWIKLVRDIDRRLADVFGASSGLAEPDKAYALMVAANGLVGHMATIVETTAQNVLRAIKSGVRHARSLEPLIGWEDLEATFSRWAPGGGRINPFAANVRPRPDAVPALGTVAAFDPEGDYENSQDDDGDGDDRVVVVRRKKRRNDGDAKFRP